MLNFRFLATVTARAMGNEKADYMPDREPKKLIKLDDMEGYFRALAEAGKRNGK